MLKKLEKVQSNLQVDLLYLCAMFPFPTTQALTLIQNSKRSYKYFSHSSSESMPSLSAALRMLGLSRAASKDEVKQAFRAKALDSHPDTAGGDSSKFRQLKQSYEVALEYAERNRYARQNMGAPNDVNAQRAAAEQFMRQFTNNPEALRTAHERVRENMNKADEYNTEILRRMKQDHDQRRKMPKEEHRWRKELRAGWVEEGLAVERLVDDGRVVRHMKMRVTAPDTEKESGADNACPGFGESEWEEWIGDDGAPRQRTLVQMPVRFGLARKVFGDVPFRSQNERNAAKEEFGKSSIAMKRISGFFSTWEGWGSG